jgi:hypothetical protein
MLKYFPKQLGTQLVSHVKETHRGELGAQLFSNVKKQDSRWSRNEFFKLALAWPKIMYLPRTLNQKTILLFIRRPTVMFVKCRVQKFTDSSGIQQTLGL